MNARNTRNTGQFLHRLGVPRIPLLCRTPVPNWQPRPSRSFGCPVELDGNGLGIAEKVGVGGEDLPAASERDRADQKVDGRADDATGTALITQLSRLLEVFC